MNYNGSIFEAATGFAFGAIIFSFFWGLIVLVPTSITQFLCARALDRANCHNYQRFLVGLLNPSIAIATVIAVGLFAASKFTSNT